MTMELCISSRGHDLLRAAIENLPIDDLLVALAEIQVWQKTGDDTIAGFDVDMYDRKYETIKRLYHDGRLALDAVHEHLYTVATDDIRLIDGSEVHICPYGCHTADLDSVKLDHDD